MAKLIAKTKTTARGTTMSTKPVTKKSTGNYFIDVKYIKTTYYKSGSLLHYAVTSKLTAEQTSLIKKIRGEHYAETATKQPILTSPKNGGLITQFEFDAKNQQFYVRENDNIKLYNVINKKVIDGTMAPALASIEIQPLRADAMLG
jgi:hypothetical protein